MTTLFQVGVDVHPRKKFSFSSERLSETVSQFSERSTTVSLADETGGGNSVAASTRALAGSLLAYRVSLPRVSLRSGFLGCSSIIRISWSMRRKDEILSQPQLGSLVGSLFGLASKYLGIKCL